MLPPKQEKPDYEELIPHIVNKLSANEEPYKIGAWENFNFKKKNRTIFWLRSAAAILLLGFTLFFLYGERNYNLKQQNAVIKDGKTNRVVNGSEEFVSKIIIPKSKENNGFKTFTNRGQSLTVTNKKLTNLLTQSSHKINKQNATNLNTIEQDIHFENNANYDPKFTLSNKKSQKLFSKISPKTNKQKTINLATKYKSSGLNNLETIDNIYTINNIVLHKKNQTQTEVLLENSIANYILVDSIKNEKIIIPQQTSKRTIDFLAAQTTIAESEKSIKKSSKWLLGLSIAPSLGNTPKLNMGYGLNMEYVISPKFSVNSGIGYNQLSATKNFDNANVFSEAVAIRSPEVTLKNMESINANMGGIDIPLEIKYNINKSIYVNIGISAFAVLNQQQSNSFIEEKLVTQIIVTTAGEQQENSFLVYERSTQPFSENQDDIPNYVAFYNLSFGFRQKITKKTFIGFEPFVKLPVQEITAQKLRLMGSGLRLRINF